MISRVKTRAALLDTNDSDRLSCAPLCVGSATCTCVCRPGGGRAEVRGHVGRGALAAAPAADAKVADLDAQLLAYSTETRGRSGSRHAVLGFKF